MFQWDFLIFLSDPGDCFCEDDPPTLDSGPSTLDACPDVIQGGDSNGNGAVNGADPVPLFDDNPVIFWAAGESTAKINRLKSDYKVESRGISPPVSRGLDIVLTVRLSKGVESMSRYVVLSLLVFFCRFPVHLKRQCAV